MGGGGYEGEKKFAYLKWAFHFWFSIQNFTFPHSSFGFGCGGWFGQGGVGVHQIILPPQKKWISTSLFRRHVECLATGRAKSASNNPQSPRCIGAAFPHLCYVLGTAIVVALMQRPSTSIGPKPTPIPQGTGLQLPGGEGGGGASQKLRALK